jgi:subfamily B ATP-binding cassette protein MsbA
VRKLFKGVDPRFLQMLKEQKGFIVPGLICSAVAALMLSGYIVLIKFAIDAISGEDSEIVLRARDLTGWDSSALVMLSGGLILLLYLARYFFVRGQFYYMGMAANRLTADLRIKLYDKLQRLPLRYFQERRAGSIQSVLTNDVQVFQQAVNTVRNAIDGPLKIVVGLVSAFVLQPLLSLTAVVVLPLMAITIQRNSKKMKKAQGEVQNSLSRLTAMMQESLHGARIIKAFNAEKKMSRRFEGFVDETYDKQRDAVVVVSKLRPMVELLGAVAIGAVVVICGFLVARDLITVGDLAAFVAALDVVNQGARSIGNLNQTMAQISAANERIHSEVLDVPETLADRDGAREPESIKGEIAFEDVGFVYPDGTRALKNVSFTVRSGESLALVGPSGSGKSTLADLILRFNDPTEGRILLDGTDLREIKIGWLRSHIGVVPQQTFLFAGPISENLKMGHEEATDQEMEEAARKAHADGFIERTADRYETELGEQGVRLSGGEGQRLAIARALTKDPAILLLDEATSNLDAVSEKLVTDALEEASEGRTTLLIAHRLSTAARADRILMLHSGEAIEIGSHEELMQKDGAYAGMYRAFSTASSGPDAPVG